MLTYDTSGRCFGLTLVCQWKGSVVPRAMPQATAALVICIITHVIWMGGEKQDKDDDDMVSDPYSHQILGMILAFLLVFRSGTAYSRYWEGVTTMHWLTSKLHDLTYQTKWFVKHNNTSVEFQLEMARFLRLFYATVMQELNRIEGDLPGELHTFGGERYFHKDNRGQLTEKGRRECQLLLEANKRPPVVMSWISELCVQRFQQGGIVALPPVFARMFQQMSEAMLGYADALKIVMTPIPFPYSQMNGFVLYLFGLTWPIMCAVMVPMLSWAAAISFLVVLAFFSIDAIATELQDPFGNDNNDLPLMEIMQKFEYEVESVIVLDGTVFPDVKGFRTPLTADDRLSKRKKAMPGQMDPTDVPGPYIPQSSGATYKFDAQSVCVTKAFAEAASARGASQTF